MNAALGFLELADVSNVNYREAFLFWLFLEFLSLDGSNVLFCLWEFRDTLLGFSSYILFESMPWISALSIAFS